MKYRLEEQRLTLRIFKGVIPVSLALYADNDELHDSWPITSHNRAILALWVDELNKETT